jgi:DNA-binding NarL/FixJ family response regulator
MPTKMDDPIRVLVVDDHPIIVEGLSLILEAEDIRVVGSAGTLASALAQAATTRPDVVLLDLHLPDGSGASAIESFAAAGAAVLVLTMTGDPHVVRTALDAGANGYLVKGATRHEILASVRAVAAGQVVLGAAIDRRVLTHPEEDVPFPELTDREREVLRLVGSGADNPTIGRHLGISAKTVANHVSAILFKLGVSDRTQAALLQNRRDAH